MFKLTIGPGATKLSLQYAQESQQAMKVSVHKDRFHVISDECQTWTLKAHMTLYDIYQKGFV